MKERIFRVVTVDDEELARSLLREHLAAHDDVELVAECANGFEAVKAVAELAPDILFLDVQMPKLDGFEVVELLDPAPTVVFVTAYDQYAVKAFEVHAVDYLLKPFRKERFDEALDRARSRVLSAEPGAAKTAAVKTAALAARESERPLRRLAVKDGDGIVVIPTARLSLVEAQDDYVLLHVEGKRYLKQQTLASLEAQLDPARFVRVHRSALLNVDALQRLERDAAGGGTAFLSDDRHVPVSRAGLARLRERLGL